MTQPTIHTFDYAALTMAKEDGLPGDVDRGTQYSRGGPKDLQRTEAWQHLVDLGLLKADTKANPKKSKDTFMASNEADTVTTFRLSTEGETILTAIEASWEDECTDLDWWNVSTNRGIVVLGLPGIHPEEAMAELRVFFGNTIALSPPRDEDEPPGRLRKKPAAWRPWKDASQSWIDMSEEGKPRMRGAFMRPFGDPIDPALAFMESLGRFVPRTGQYPHIADEVIRDMARVHYTLKPA